MAANLYPTIWKPVNAVTITAGASIWTPASGRKFRLLKYALVASAAGVIQLKDGAGGTLILAVPSAAGGIAYPVDLGGKGILSAAADNILQAIGITGSVSGWVAGIEE